MAEKTAQQYILLPPRGLSAGDVVPLTLGVSSFFTRWKQYAEPPLQFARSPPRR